MPFPPVFMMAALVPPRFPPSSIAVIQNALSHNPSSPSARVNQVTTHPTAPALIPASRQAALANIPSIGKINRFCRPKRHSMRPINQPPIGMAAAIARLGSPA